MFLHELDTQEKEAFAEIARELIRADGNISSEEDFYMELFLKEMSLEVMPEEMTREEAIAVFEKSDSLTKKQVYMELYSLAKCDHEYDEKEKNLMDDLAGLFEIPEDKQRELEDIIDDFTGLYIRLNRALL